MHSFMVVTTEAWPILPLQHLSDVVGTAADALVQGDNATHPILSSVQNSVDRMDVFSGLGTY